MGTINSLVIGVSGSIIASYLLYLFGILGKLMPWRFTKPLYDLGIGKGFVDQKHALRSILKDASISKTVRVLAVKGDTFSYLYNKDVGSLNAILTNTSIEQKYLISSPDNPYLITRGKELHTLNLSAGVSSSVKHFKECAEKNTNIECRLHSEIVRFRLIIFSHCLYISFQQENIEGRKSPMIRIKSLSPMYNTYVSYFEDIWAKYNKEDTVDIVKHIG